MAAPLMVAQLAFTALGAAQQSRMASMQRDAAVNAANANAAAANGEYTRQQQEVNRTAQEQMNDRQRQFASDLGAIRVAASEGSAMGDRMTLDASYTAGMDLSRIESNRDSQVAALQSKKVAVNQAASNEITVAGNQAKAAKTGTVFQAIGSGIQIGANYEYRQERLKALQNTAY